MPYISKTCIVLLLLISVASASYICGRTATSDTYCNSDGTRTTTFYSYQTNILTDSGYQPFEDVASLEYKDDHFELSYNGQVARIDLFAIVDSKETATKDTELKITPVIIKQRGGFEYGVTLDNADKIEAFGFRIAGDDIKEVKYDFSDTVTDKTSLEMLDSKTAVVRNINASKQLTIDPLITLNATNSANIGDSETRQESATTNYGTGTTMTTASVTSKVRRAFILFNCSAVLPDTGITITDARLSFYQEAVTGSFTAQVYNTTGNWTETGITYTNMPATDTLQGSFTPAASARFSVDVTAAVVAGCGQSGHNASFTVRHSTEAAANEFVNFTTKEGATAGNRPYMNVTYTTTTTYPETGMVGYWKFDEGSGSNTVDSSGNENSGTITGASWTTSKYRMNSTLSYDGVNRRVDIIDSAILNVSSVTISAWVNPSSVQSGDGTVISKADGADTAKGYRLLVSPSASLMYIGNGTEQAVSCLQANTGWNHFVGSFNATTKSLSIYKNGVLCNSATIVGTMQNSTYVLSIAFRPNWNYYFNGTIDEVKIYNVSQSSAWVLTEYLKNGCLYNMNVSCFNESSTSQQIYYDLILTNTTASQTFSNAYNWTSNQYCNGSTPMNSVTLTVSNDSFYSPRYRYVDTATSPNVTAYLLPLNAQYPVLTTFTVLYGSTAVQNAKLTLKKLIGSSWMTIAEGMTDSAGNAGFNLDYTTAYYIITNATGYAVRYDTLTPTKTGYLLYLSYGMAGSELWSYYNQVAWSCTVDNSSYPASIDIACYMNDSSGLMKYGRLRAWQIGLFGTSYMCDQTNSSVPNVTMNCTISNVGNQTITYSLVGHFQDEHAYEQRTLEFREAIALLKTYGLFPSLFLVLTMTLAMSWNPALMPIGAVVGIAASKAMYLIDIPLEAIVALAVLAIAIAYKMHT